MTYLIINDGAKYTIATIIEAYKNNILVTVFPDNQKRKIKLDQQIYQLATLTASNILQFNHKVEQLIKQLDLDLLAELIDDCNINYTIQELAELYFGNNYSHEELTALLFAIADHIIMFNDHKNGSFNKLTLAEQEQQRLLILQKEHTQQIFNNYYNALIELKNPHFDTTVNIIKLLNKPDKNSIAYLALLKASKTLAISQIELCSKVGIIGDLAQFYVASFMLENFPHGMNYNIKQSNMNLLPEIESNLNLKIFSIDDSTTTEIDDAFSVQVTSTGATIGIHIAAPALDPKLAEMVCENISTIYFPNNKITMLPESIINQFSLDENKKTPVVSIYFDLDHDLNILEYYSKVELVRIAHNLRITELELIFNHNSLATEQNYPYEAELKLLYKFATKLEETRGKPSINNITPDYTFSFSDSGKIIITPRIRGNPIDKLVSELMILANCTWGRMLTNAFIPTIYRVKQPNFPVKMTLTADSHTGLNVSYYTWATSPLRRSVDYINQHQIISLVTKQKNYYTATDPIILDVVENFDSRYARYIDFQNKMERYWSLKYLIQENITEISATFVHKSKAQLDGLPLDFDTQGFITAKPRGSQINLKIFNLNLGTLTFDFKILP